MTASVARLHALCAAYGERPVAVIEALDALQSREAARIERLGRRGTEPWTTFLARGDAAEMLAEQCWIRSERDALLDAGRYELSGRSQFGAQGQGLPVRRSPIACAHDDR